MAVPHFLCSSVCEHLRDFDFREVINNTVVYIGMPVYVTCAVSNPSTCLRIEFLGHLLPHVYAAEESPDHFLWWPHHPTFPLPTHEDLNVSSSLPTLDTLTLPFDLISY